MAQSNNPSLDNISLEHYHLPLIQQRTTSGYSSFSADSQSNLIRQGEPIERERQNSLPTFYPSGSREVITSSTSNNASGGVNWRNAFAGWKIVVLGSWLNVLLILIPISWGMTLTMKHTHGLTFALSILALIPLVRLHDVSTRELAARIGGNRTGLLNGSMSNFVEIIVAISALRKCELRVVQSSLIGSMLSKMLLVLGLCFFAGGMRFSEQGFDATATQIHSSLLSLSVGAVLLPAAYHFTLGNESDPTAAAAQKQNILKMSHAVSIVLLFIYVAYLLFQFWSHTYLYSDDHNKKSHRLSTVIKEERNHRHRERLIASMAKTDSRMDISSIPQSLSTSTLSPPRRPFAPPSPLSSSSEITLQSPSPSEMSTFEKNQFKFAGPSTVRLVGNKCSVPMSRESTVGSGFSSPSSAAETLIHEGYVDRGPGEPHVPGSDAKSTKEPQLSWFLTILLLVLVTGAVAITVDWLVESMDGISTTISKEWIGLILLPGITSIAECLTAVRVSVKDELSLSVSVAVGSTLQTALLVIPFTVILAWITNKPLSLLMDPFQSMVLYIAVHTVGYVVADGKSNWLEGVILVCLYIIIAVSYWFYPGSDLPSSLAQCIIS